MTMLTSDEICTRRAGKLPTWLLDLLPFAGTPLDNGRSCGGLEQFYADEAEARAVFAGLCESGHVERVGLVLWRPATGGGWYRTTMAEWEAPPATPVEIIDGVTWWGSEADGFDGEDGCCTVAHVRRAEAGEAEGGLGALMRLMAGARGVGILPAPSPAGWYWNAAIRGVWTGPQLAESPEIARAAASAQRRETCRLNLKGN
jgi:hypothetical protein